MTTKISLFFQVRILSVPLAWCFLSAPAMAADLTLFVEKQKAVFHIRAVGAYETTSFNIQPQAGFTRKLVQIYEQIEQDSEKDGTLDKVGDYVGEQYRTVSKLITFWKEKKETREEESPETVNLEQLLTEAGNLFYGPIEPLVRVSRHIEFVISEAHLFYPLDVLHVAGRPLFLQKKVSFRITSKKIIPPKAAAGWRGLIIAEQESDPEDGAAAVWSQFPGSLRFAAERVKREDLAGVAAVDFILLSAQGGVEGLQLKNLILRPETLSGLKPDLIYLDSDLYGLNTDFINHFAQAGVIAYVAPIFTRQTGKATAQTMIRFFRRLHGGEDPARALYLARKTIYDASALKGEEKLNALRQAFPFRLYYLN
jgi:hypothetical protein